MTTRGEGRSRKTVHHPDMPLLQVDHVTYAYNGKAALADVSFALNVGERVAVVGPNGAGKSTLFRVIAGILKPTHGSVTIAGSGPGHHICIAYVPQRTQVDWQFPVNVADVVMMGRIGQIGLFRRPRAADWAYVHQCLTVVGMRDFAQRQIGELSGGQQQRVFIARALAQEAELMLMDEPLTGLDVTSQDDIFDILDELRQRRVTVMVATHDLELAAARFDRLMLLQHHLVGFGQAADVLTPTHLRDAYGGHLRLIHTEDGDLIIGDTCCDQGDNQ
ncbi:MAG: metal ABC transporter ATP-binding protein [Anaerolineales bacterium]|nr:metal ABC transporter ATP-binding protein [Anaerolineales bacterium]MCB8953990.1 metal ABC transporter ATP-binding protein [Ardenticatenales bacterium]